MLMTEMLLVKLYDVDLEKMLLSVYIAYSGKVILISFDTWGLLRAW
jgi:hypothetical protein